MSDGADELARLWRDGVGPDDAPWLRARDGEPEALLFRALLELIGGALARVPIFAHPPATVCVAAAGRVLAARLAHDVAGLETAVEHLDRALLAVPASDPRAPAARAWTDVALAEVALALGDPAMARSRLEAVAADDTPLALRVAAQVRLAALAMGRFEPSVARKLAKAATALAEASQRPLLAARARTTWALAELMAGDATAMRATLARPIAEGDAYATVLAASLERDDRAFDVLAGGLRTAAERGDPAGYLLLVLVGARRYVQLGRDGDALITVAAGIAQLERIAPELAGVLAKERAGWQTKWGAARYAQAERAALAALAPS